MLPEGVAGGVRRGIDCIVRAGAANIQPSPVRNVPTWSRVSDRHSQKGTL